ncbi:MAG: anti-sigma factor family protein [Fimbriimonadaceae bacterium]
MENLDRLTCEEAFRRLDDYLDRELTPHEMELVRKHLETCEACRRHDVFESTVLQQLRAKICRIDMPPQLMAEIHRRLAEQD